MPNIMVAGTGTDIGKTVVSAILTTLLKGDYWKPIQCGTPTHSDTATMQKLIDVQQHEIHLPVYALKAPLSPHHAARLENITIDIESIIPPLTTRPLIIEGVGGVYVPLTTRTLSIDLFKLWDCRWILVSKHELGSINHTLLTCEALKSHRVSLAGIIFNGQPSVDSEAAILEISGLPLIGRLFPEAEINRQTIQRYAKQWQNTLPQLIQ